MAALQLEVLIPGAVLVAHCYPLTHQERFRAWLLLGFSKSLRDDKKLGRRQVFHSPIDFYVFQAMEQQIREEQRMMDEKIVLELDQKVIDQQNTLEKAGVSGFYITTNPQNKKLLRKGQSLLLPAAETGIVYLHKHLSAFAGADSTDEFAGADSEAAAEGS
uniref:Uncharacterized protein n=1 Tax=Cyanistes caeruleus TaxID=156563 RepID=A0A8C0U648_CYACU